MKLGFDVCVIGGGPAGLAAAISACDNGAKVCILEREEELGGVLKQCIHNGFGLTRFKENLTGPEYAQKFIDEVSKRDIRVLTGTTVLSVGGDKTVKAIGRDCGVFEVQAKSIVLAMGCRERSRGAINVPGSRPAGIFSAGTAQKLMNVYGRKVGTRVVIVGSGDIGLIMARRLTLEGASVLAVCEIMEYSSGLSRNIAQCLNDFEIPLYLSTTVTEIVGKDRVEGVWIASVGKDKKPVSGTERYIPCDTVLFSVGLIPENELLASTGVKISASTKGATVDQYRETEIEGIFECGNALHVHDLVDFVSQESEIAGKYAATRQKADGEFSVDVTPGENVSYVLPQRVSVPFSEPFDLYYRVKTPIENAVSELVVNGEVKKTKKSIKALPGEMQYIAFDVSELKKGDKIEVRVYGK